MPVMNGFQAARKINELQKEHKIKKFPVIALTANTSAKDIEECKASFMKEYLSKPISKQKFKETLEIILKMQIVEGRNSSPISIDRNKKNK